MVHGTEYDTETIFPARDATLFLFKCMRDFFPA